jgi:hypothetical protein
VRLWITLFLVCLSSAVFAQGGSVVTIDADKILVLNGQKVFPITLSPGPPTNAKTPTGGDALDEFRDAGALCIRMVQTTDWNESVITNQQAQLDWAAQHGMYCMVNLRELSHFADGNTNREASLRNMVNLFKNHPALAFWKNKDEAWWGGVSAEDLQRGYEVIKQEDPFHPVEQTHAPRGTLADLQPYNAAADIIALDIYPVGYPPGANSLLTNKEISMVGDYTDFMAQVANGQKQYWMVEQIAWSGVVPPGKTLRFPTYTQSRYMAYQSIIKGARGLMFFGGNVSATLNPRDAALGWNWTFWDEVLKPVVRQLSRTNLLGDALVAPDSNRPIQVSGASDVEFCVREVPPYLHILAAKREGATVNVTFSGLPESAGAGELLYESPRTVSATNGTFSDWFGPFEVHVYRFNVPNDPPAILSSPQSRTNYVGTTATFNVFATGSPPLSYQWRKDGENLSNGGNISGVTSTILTISNVVLSDSGAFDVVVSGYGAVTSAPPAVLTVTEVPTSPFIISQPQSRINYPGTTATFSVTAGGTGPLSFQWRKNGANLSDVGNVSGAVSALLTLTNISQSDVAAYDVIISGYGSVTSSPPATLTITSNALILYESFDYSNFGVPVSSNSPSNWALNGSGANDLTVVPGSLSYSGLMNSVGNSVTNGGAGPGVRRLFGTTITSGVLYFSGLFRVNEIGASWNGSSSQVGALTAPDNTSFRLAVMVQRVNQTNYAFGLQKGGTTGVTAVFEATNHVPRQTIFLVGKYDFNATPNRVSLWINPDATTFGAGIEPTNNVLTVNTGTDGYSIDRFNMRQNTATSVPAAMQWDELRFGRTWAQVTPVGPAAQTPILLTNVMQLNDGAFQFDYLNVAGGSYLVYASTNLAHWESVGSATEIGSNLFQFTDTTATNHPKRFYQLRSQ